MTTSTLQQYAIADFLEWHGKKRLELNPYFQRGDVWTRTAQSYLIDTILRQLPIPKIYLRTIIDLETRTTIREVVDGQQRLRSIIKFASDKLQLDKRTGEFSGFTYSQLDAELQEIFLSYQLGVEQLINASNEDVLEVFSRLNSYNVVLNDAEQRHAKYQDDFKWEVHRAAKRWTILWDKFAILSLRGRARMKDDQLMAEMFGILLDGIVDGGQRYLDKLYARSEDNYTEGDPAVRKVDLTLSFITEKLESAIEGPIARPTHFLMLFSAVAHALVGIPRGAMEEDFPARDDNVLSDLDLAISNITTLASIIEQDEPPDDRELTKFWDASKRRTTRISSRRIRFLWFYHALFPNPL